jgi:hypothetical protein
VGAALRAASAGDEDEPLEKRVRRRARCALRARAVATKECSGSTPRWHAQPPHAERRGGLYAAAGFHGAALPALRACCVLVVPARAPRPPRARACFKPSSLRRARTATQHSRPEA